MVIKELIQLRRERTTFAMMIAIPLIQLVLFGYAIDTNLAVGYTFSTVARSQLQAMQMAVMFFLPSILLSGFMFPFLGMPRWAQWLGEMLPLTHFLRMVRGVMLKDSGVADLSQEVLALGGFTVAVMLVAAVRFRRILD